MPHGYETGKKRVIAPCPPLEGVLERSGRHEAIPDFKPKTTGIAESVLSEDEGSIVFLAMTPVRDSKKIGSYNQHKPVYWFTYDNLYCLHCFLL